MKGGWSLRTGSEKGAGLAVRGEQAGLYIRLPALRFPARGPLIILLSCLKSFLKDLLCAAQRGQVAWPIAGHSAQRSWVEFSPGVFLHSPVSYAVCWVSVQWLSHVELFVTPWTAACQASLFINNSWSLLKLMSIEYAIQPSHPLSSPSPPAFSLSQHQGLFQRVSSSHQVAKVLALQLQPQSFQ